MKTKMTPSQKLEIFNKIATCSYQKLRRHTVEAEPDDTFLSKCDQMLDAYISPSGYMSWNDYVKFSLISGSLKSLECSFGSSDVRGAIACTAFRNAVTDNACARYVSKSIVESFAQTALPELPSEVIHVLPYVHLMLPRHTVYDAEGDEVISILIQSGKLYADSLTDNHADMLRVCFPNEKLAPQELLGAEGLQIITFTKGGMDVFQEFITPDAKSWHESNVKNVSESKYENPRTEALVRIAVNSLLVHLYEPELITTDPTPTTKGIGFSGKSKQPLSPTWIGKTFKLVKDKISAKHDKSERDAVRSHWRRGHWHTVCVGPKKSERRVQWFKPIYVNPTVEKANVN